MSTSEDDKLAFEILNSLEYLEERESVTLATIFDSFFRAYADDNKTPVSTSHIDIDQDYNGLKLGENFEEGDFKAMFHDFRNNRPLHAKYAIRIVEEAIEVLKRMPNIREFELKEDECCIVVGDLHGHFDDLASIISRFNIPGKTHYFVFNGDWVDRGQHQVEVLLTIFYSLILFPDRVFLNRGNHEDYTQNSHYSYKPCLKAITEAYFKQYAPNVYKKLDELFCHLPLATIIENPLQQQRIFVVHGGINSEMKLEEIAKIDRTKFDSICKPRDLGRDSLEAKQLANVQDMLWSDPYPSDDEDHDGERFNYLRNIGKHFGVSVTKAFLERHNLTSIIRSHECKSEGFKVMHDGKLVTVFSASSYNQDNHGCVLKICSDKPRFDVLSYASSQSKQYIASEDQEDNLTWAIKQLRKRIYELRPMLMKDFKRIDKASLKYVTIDELVTVLKKYLPNIPYYEIKDRICECDDNADKAKYESLFAFMSVNSKYQTPECIANNHQILQAIFEKIDKDGSGTISANEFEDACTKALQRLDVNFTKKEIKEFMKEMDKNKDGQVDLQEFKNAFEITFTKNGFM